MKRIIVLIAVGSLLLLPIHSSTAQGQGVGVIDTEPDISNVEIERKFNGYDVNFTITHLNGVNSIYSINMELMDGDNTPTRNFGIEFTQNGTTYHGDVPEDLSIKRRDTRQDIEDSKMIFMDVVFSISGEDYSRAIINVIDINEDEAQREVQFPSLISGLNLSIVSFPVVGSLVAYGVISKRAEGGNWVKSISLNSIKGGSD